MAGHNDAIDIVPLREIQNRLRRSAHFYRDLGVQIQPLRKGTDATQIALSTNLAPFPLLIDRELLPVGYNLFNRRHHLKQSYLGFWKPG